MVRARRLSNAEIGETFLEIADLLELQNDNPFRIRAYRDAARTVGNFGRDIVGLIASGETLPKLPGIGADLAGKIEEIARTGESALLRKLRSQFPPMITQLLRIPGIGPRRAREIHGALDVQTPQQLLDAARQGRLRALPRFGERLERNVLAATQRYLESGRRTLLPRRGHRRKACAPCLARRLVWHPSPALAACAACARP
jgi:DNA polymerase (family 10)